MNGTESRPTATLTRRTALALAMVLLTASRGSAQQAALPSEVPPGTAIVVADQNEQLQSLMAASGEGARLSSRVTYANFLGGPAILEAFRAGALDLATVGNTPPIQAQAAGETIPIVAAIRTAGPDYRFAVRPGMAVSRLEDLRGKRIAYAEGSGRQPFVLGALKQAGLTRKDVTLIPLRVSDFPDAIRGGQVDVAALNEPHYSRYLANERAAGASGLPETEYARLPKGLSYLYASRRALSDPAKTAAIREFVVRWMSANRWSDANPQAWVAAYYVKRQRLAPQDGMAIVAAQGAASFPRLSTVVDEQQGLVDLIQAAGDIPKRLDARDEFDLRFDDVVDTRAE